MLTKDQVSKLLNRPLTTAENTNFSLYLDIATERLEELICSDLCIKTLTRTYEVRQGYRTIYTDIFRGTPVVSVDGTVQEATDYSVRQFDDLNGSWFNSIVFKKFLPRTAKEVTVEASWGFGTLPSDLQLLLAKLFELNTKSQTEDERVRSKKIEDFSITKNDNTLFDQFKIDNADVLSKYSICLHSEVQHGGIYNEPVYTIC